jgi:hypothetical protein
MASYCTKAHIELDLQTQENFRHFDSVISGFEELSFQLEGFKDRFNDFEKLLPEEFVANTIQLFKAETLKEFAYPSDSILLFKTAGCPCGGELFSPEPYSKTVMLFQYFELIPAGLDLLIQYAIKTYNLPPLGFCYCCTADEASIDAYWGGACWITKDSIEWLDAHSWLQEKAKHERP